MVRRKSTVDESLRPYVRSLLDQGVSDFEIADAYGCSKSAVRKCVQPLEEVKPAQEPAPKQSQLEVAVEEDLPTSGRESDVGTGEQNTYAESNGFSSYKELRREASRYLLLLALKSWKPEGVSSQLGVSTSYLSHMKRGSRRISDVRFEKLLSITALDYDGVVSLLHSKAFMRRLKDGKKLLDENNYATGKLKNVLPSQEVVD